MSAEEFHIEEVDLQPHDWDRGVDRIHVLRVRRMSIVIIHGPGVIQAAGFSVNADHETARDLAEGFARAQHYNELVRRGLATPLGRIREPARA